MVRKTLDDGPSIGELVDRAEVILSGSCREPPSTPSRWCSHGSKRERVARGVSLKDLAERSGIALATLSRLEGGKIRTPPLRRYRGSTALGLELRLRVRGSVPGKAESPTPRLTLHSIWNFRPFSITRFCTNSYRTLSSDHLENLNEDDLKAWLTLESGDGPWPRSSRRLWLARFRRPFGPHSRKRWSDRVSQSGAAQTH